MAIVFVYLCGIPFAEAVGADTLIAKIVAHKGKLFLDCPFGDREQGFGASNGIAQNVVFQILADDKGDCENALLPCHLGIRANLHV